jgi:hypothetical protein
LSIENSPVVSVICSPSLVRRRSERSNSKGPKVTVCGSLAGAPGLPAGAAAQHGVDAGQQLARVEGLGQVVVGAHFQADDAVHVLDLGGQHDDGRAVAGGAQAAADGQAVLAGQHQVQHDQVDGLAGLQRASALASSASSTSKPSCVR